MSFTGLELLGLVMILLVGFIAVDFFVSLFRKPGFPKYKCPPPPPEPNTQINGIDLLIEINKDNISELELAIEYLKERAVSTEKIKDPFIRQFIAVLAISEVEVVLEMVKSNTFSTFYDEIKKKQ